jgi:hypothetical protein
MGSSIEVMATVVRCIHLAPSAIRAISRIDREISMSLGRWQAACPGSTYNAEDRPAPKIISV